MKHKYFLRRTLTGLACAFLLAVGVFAAYATAADDAFICMEASQEKCDYENENMDLFIRGRDAFDRGRESGDLTEARDYASKLIERKDLEHGQALMKFIYLQVAQGVHKDFVEAYRWVAADVAAGIKYKRLDLQWVLNKLSAKMTPEQLAEARK
jgi:hypothetical protein